MTMEPWLLWCAFGVLLLIIGIMAAMGNPR